MKKLYGALCALLISSQASAGGLAFMDDSFDKAMVKAKQENKMVLVYLDSPKRSVESLFMTGMLFPIHKVGDLYNDRFVSLKQTAGENQELTKLAEQQGVTAYPACLILDGNGNVVSKSQGTKDLEEFIEFGQKALSGDKVAAF